MQHKKYKIIRRTLMIIWTLIAIALLIAINVLDAAHSAQLRTFFTDCVRVYICSCFVLVPVVYLLKKKEKP